MSVWDRGPIVAGHRGGRGGGWPRENTVAAFEQARREGAPAVELDVRTCAGGSVVVFHDATLSSATGGEDVRRLSDVGLRELRAMGILTLEEALSWARFHRVGVNVEMKHDVTDRVAFARVTARTVRAAGADVLLSSFDPVLLGLAAPMAPAIVRALLVRARQPLWAEALQRLARPPFVGWVNLERGQVNASAVDHHTRRGLRVGAWTVNDPAEAADFVHLGVASIITDAPGAIIEALGLTRT